MRAHVVFRLYERPRFGGSCQFEWFFVFGSQADRAAEGQACAMDRGLLQCFGETRGKPGMTFNQRRRLLAPAV